MKLSLVLMFAPTSVAYEAYETYQGPDNKEHHCWYCCENSTNLKFCWDRCESKLLEKRDWSVALFMSADLSVS